MITLRITLFIHKYSIFAAMEKLNIVSNRSKDDSLTEELKQSGLPVVLYGIGLIADTAQIYLQKRGIPVSCRVIDDKYLDPLWHHTGSDRILSISGLQNEYSAYNLLLCFFGGYKNDLQPYRQLFPGARTVAYLSSIYEQGAVQAMESSYVLTHKPEFDGVYDLLEDSLSRDSMQAYINAKINKDASYLFPYVRRPQYFSETNQVPALRLHQNEIMVNCGAFTGDTIKDFLEVTSRRFGKIYACEPDSANLQKLARFVQSAGIADRTEIVSKCISDKAGTVYFLNQGNMLSRKSETPGPGVVTLQSDTIDNILDSRPVSLIVMDVEGNELKALEGARKTIQSHQPLLALAAYHKKDDLPVLTTFLKKLVPAYRFYFRVHKPMAIDAVLYASTRNEQVSATARYTYHPPPTLPRIISGAAKNRWNLSAPKL